MSSEHSTHCTVCAAPRNEREGLFGTVRSRYLCPEHAEHEQRARGFQERQPDANEFLMRESLKSKILGFF